MIKYTIKRLILLPILLLLVALLVFLLLNLASGEPAAQMLGVDYTMEDLINLKHELGLDKPVLVQYANWVWNALHGDFGISYSTRSDVWADIVFRIPITVKLGVICVLTNVIIGLPLGVACAVKQYSAFDYVVNIISKMLGAVPGFWLGMMGIIIFSSKLGWLPTFGLGTWKHWILPVTACSLPWIANYIRQARSAMLDCIRQDYVRTARSKGNKEVVVIFREALRNALLPIITVTGANFAMLLGGAVVIEKVFSISGIGSKVVTGINTRDIPSVLACAVLLAVFFNVVMLIIDLLYAVADPRIKATFAGKKKKKTEEKENKEVA